VIVAVCIQGSDSGNSSPVSVDRKPHRGSRQRKQKTPRSGEVSSAPATPVTAETAAVEDAPMPVDASSPVAASPDHTPTSTRTRNNRVNEVSC